MNLSIPPHVRTAINAALASLPKAMDTPEARVMLYAIGLQESRFLHRRQLIDKGGKLVPLGPAKGYWQFERGGGCKGVLTHKASRYWMVTACEAHSVPPEHGALWDAVETNTVLAAIAARLLLFTDPYRLPKLGEAWPAWDLYLRTWRPGKPHESTWPSCYATALDFVRWEMSQ